MESRGGAGAGGRRGGGGRGYDDPRPPYQVDGRGEAPPYSGGGIGGPVRPVSSALTFNPSSVPYYPRVGSDPALDGFPGLPSRAPAVSRAPASSAGYGGPVGIRPPVTAAGIRAPAAGVRAPAAGVRAPAAEIRAPAAGVRAPVDGVRAPAAGVRAPVDGVRAPAAEIRAPLPATVSVVRAPAAVEGVTKQVERLMVAERKMPELPPASTKADRFPARPGYGVKGMKCLIRANHFLVNVNYNLEIWHYDVDIKPDVTSRAINRAIIRELVHLYGASHLGKSFPAYDGRKSLYTAGQLPFDSQTFMLKLPEKDGSSSKRAEKEYTITIKYAGRPDLHHLEQFMRGRQLDCPQETIQALDVVLREKPSTNYTIVARSFFSKDFGHRGDIGDGMECWRGYYQSLRPTQMGISLNIDISATSFYKSVPVINFVAEHLGITMAQIARYSFNDRDRLKVRKALKGIRVEVTHMPGSTRRYKITGITTMPLNQLTFEDETETKISVIQYFRQKYNCSLSNLHWPCLQAGSDSRPTYLPMEVCKIVEGQRYSKKLSDKQVTGILRATCKRPPEREASIRDMVLKNDYGHDEFAKEFGMSIMPELAQVEARILTPPRLKYHETGRDKSCSPTVGQWNMIGKRMVDGGSVDSWTLLNFAKIPMEAVHRFLNDLVNMCNNIGMKFNPNPVLPVGQVRPEYIDAALRDVYKLATDEERPLQLLLVVLPESTGYYGPIKRICETDLGIVSQCCLPKHVVKSNKQYLENVSLKINVKVGGRNTILEDCLHRDGIPYVSDKPTIIFGADVTHPAPGEDSQSSIAAVVASMDWPEITKYRGLVSAQQHRKEMIQDLFTTYQDPVKGTVSGGMIREHLIAFLRATNRKPHRIIFYRDGVSEGQFNAVLLEEMDAIRKACASLEVGYLPPVTFIVVQKRHHTRLFPAVHGARDLTDRSGNIMPGTVVDTKICHPTEFDFYLCSHAGIQGTSRPTHYHVLYDENKFTADALQMLTNNLCYTYARCTRSVSVVPPAYYAHLAAFRARYYNEGDSDESSSDKAGTAGVARNRDRAMVVRPLPNIKDNVKAVMFYC